MPLAASVLLMMPASWFAGVLASTGSLRQAWDDAARSVAYLDPGVAWFLTELLIFSALFVAWRRWRPARAGGSGPLRARHLLAASALIAALTFPAWLLWPIGSYQLLGLHLWLWPQCLTLFWLGALAAERGWLDDLGRGLRAYLWTAVAAAAAAMAAGWIASGASADFGPLILIPSSSLALAAQNEGVSGGYAWTMVGLIVVGGLFALAGIAAFLVAWVKAVLNTRQLADPRWFKALLWGGIAGIVTMLLFGLGALVLGAVMTAYLVAGPDQAAAGARPAAPAKGTITTWAGWGFAAIFAGLSLALGVANWTNTGGPLHGILWPSLAILSAGITVAVTGVIVVWAAWWAALFNARTLADRTWFHRLLWSGIAAAVTMPAFGFGGLILAVVLLACWRSAPDQITARPPQLPVQMPAPAQPPGNARGGQLADARRR